MLLLGVESCLVICIILKCESIPGWRSISDIRFIDNMTKMMQGKFIMVMNIILSTTYCVLIEHYLNELLYFYHEVHDSCKCSAHKNQWPCVSAVRYTFSSTRYSQANYWECTKDVSSCNCFFLIGLHKQSTNHLLLLCWILMCWNFGCCVGWHRCSWQSC